MMATNVLFAIEDQTDEDFFDKLVDDDFSGGQEVDECQECDDVDEMTLFGFEDSAGFEVNEKLNDVKNEDNAIPAAKSNSSTSSIIENGNADGESCYAIDELVDKTDGSGNAGVKVIQWNSMFTDSSVGVEGFRSFVDLFSEGGAGVGDLSTEVKDSEVNEVKKINGGDPYVAGIVTNDASTVTYGETQAYGTGAEQNADGPEVNSIEYWERQYPGWKYDPSTGQWYQVDSHEPPANDQQVSLVGHSEGQSVVPEAMGEVSYLQQSTQSVAYSVVETATASSMFSLNQGLQDNNGYPDHMVFDPQYPGWYYDTLAQEWHTMESYSNTALASETSLPQVQYIQNGIPSSDLLSNDSSKVSYLGHEQALENVSQIPVTNEQYGSWKGVSTSSSYQYDHPKQKGLESNGMLIDHIDKNNSLVFGQYEHNGGNSSQRTSIQEQIGSLAPPVSSYENHDLKTWHPNTEVNSSENARNPEQCSSKNNLDNVDQYNGFPIESASAYNKPSAARDGQTLQSFTHLNNLNQQFNLAYTEPQQLFPGDYYKSPKVSYASQQSHQTGSQLSYNPSIGRSSAGRPPHALVSFGFGGKLILMKDNSSLVNSSYENQDSMGSSISVLNLLEVVAERKNGNAASNACEYFQTLCQQSFPGPLVGGSAGYKELNKWIDERISNCDSSDLDYMEVETLRLLLSLLRIACQNYGKLRSPFGSDTSIKANDCPESSVAKLFASVKSNGTQYGHVSHSLQQVPSEERLRATASEVQKLIVTGSKREALECALQGQLWGPALIIASQLGDQYYVDAVKQMALHQLVPGSPLQTLCLLIAGQPQAVFASDAEKPYSDARNMYQQATQDGVNSMLDNWQENLAVLTANRTKDDELVIINLGDCLWRDRNEIIAAHICYLVAEANFEPYSDTARMCLIGADHLKYPRTYANPEAIQRTELYEYSKVVGNSQFILLPFQPYKLVYAYMLAEIGKVSDSLKYCQAILKSLKTGRAPEVEFWKQLVTSLEERLRAHQQGGFSTNLAPAKLVGKLLNFFDSTTHRVIRGLPLPGPLATPQGHEQYQQPSGPRVSTSQSTVAMSSLVPSPSTEQVNEWSDQNNRITLHNRSASEPNFGRTDQADLSKEMPSLNTQNKASVSGGSRFGFGSQLLQKTMGLVLKSRSDKQAKLGESNKFYYDEMLKRWVEEGAEPPAEEASLPPPPTTTSLQNGISGNSNQFRSENHHTASHDQRSSQPSELGSGIPPIPPSSNHFSARARSGVRSRYVDTYNQGSGTSAHTFQSPPLPSVKRTASTANAKFFVPTPSSFGEQTSANLANGFREAAIIESPLTSTSNEMIHSSALRSSSTTLHRYPSMVNITRCGNGDGALPHSRRTASWGGSFSNSFSPTKASEVKPLGDMLGFSPSSYMTNDASPTNMLHGSGGSFGDDLHEVEF